MQELGLKKSKAELLSPAGNLEILKAVAAAGADAVYAAGTKFGARAYAGNLTDEELLYAIDYLHLHGKRLYLTVNTLLKESELNHQLYDYILPLYQQGLDGVIVQDIGVLSFLRDHFPGMELHASTQMTITGPEGAMLMKEMGCSRIVTARELSLAEIREIHDEVDIEIESFIHGALCYCYSGQCLLSSILGGRSGNRGKCAQPCRLPYKTRKTQEAFLLSPKDLCTIELLPQIIESGVYSLKIEGRMKQAEYAAGVTGIYRRYLDQYLEHPAQKYRVLPEDLKKLEDLGSRSGFTKGYYIQQNGPDMMAMEKPAHTKSNDALQEEVRQRYLHQEIQEKMNGKLRLSKEFPAELMLKCKGREISVSGDVVQQAKSRPMDRNTIEEKMKKTGGSGFVFDTLEIELEDDIFIPVGALNQLRRDGIELLREKLTEPYRRIEKRPYAPIKASIAESLKKKSDIQNKNCLAVSVQTMEQCMQLLKYPYVDRVYIDSGAFDRDQECRQLAEMVTKVHKAGKRLFYIMPVVMRSSTTRWYKEHFQELVQTGMDGVLTGNYEALHLITDGLNRLRQTDSRKNFIDIDKTEKTENRQLFILADSSLYAWSERAEKALMEAGADEITLPTEANEQELRKRPSEGGELILYGYLPLMNSAQCVVKNTAGCAKKAGFTAMTDRYNKVFTVKNQCKDCYNVIYNTSPLSLLHQYQPIESLKTKAYRISFTIESREQIAEIMSYYEQGFLRKEKIDMDHYLKDFTKGHFKRGVE